MSEPGKKYSWKRFESIRYKKGDFSKRVRKMEKSSLRHARKFVTARLDRLSLVRRVVVGWVALVVILAGVSLAQWFGFRAAYLTEAPIKGGAYSEGVLGPLESLNPIFARTSAEKSAARLLFAGLYNYDTTGNLKSDLAKSVTVNETQTEYTVALRPSLKWSDGAPLTAKDVVFTVNLLKNPTVRAEISGWNSIKAEQVDSHTVKFILPGAYAPFMDALTFPVLPEHVQLMSSQHRFTKMFLVDAQSAVARLLYVCFSRLPLTDRKRLLIWLPTLTIIVALRDLSDFSCTSMVVVAKLSRP